MVRYGAPGPDGTWRTVDDEPTEWSTEEIDSSLRASTTLDYVEPGSDGAWGTDDDRIGSAGRAAFADLGLGTIRRFEWRLLSSEAGTDGAWATEDDPVAHYYAYVYGSDGELVSSSEAVSSGEDAVWETSDDGVATRTRYAWIDHDIAFRATVARGPTDVPWDFDTGTPFLAWHLQRDATAGTLESRLSSAPGPDGVWGTSDDPVAFRSSSACSDGSTFETSHFSESGDDGVWGTRDDVIVREETWTATGDCPASVCALVAPF